MTAAGRGLAIPALTRRSVLGLGALGGAAALAGCGSGGAGGSGSEGGARTVRACVYARNHASSPLFWQQFAPEGVTVDITIVTSAADVLTGLSAGNLDVGLLGPYAPLLSLTEVPFEGKILAMCARGGLDLIGATGMVESLEDLAGKRVAVPPPGQQTLVLKRLLDGIGLTLDGDVTGIPLAYADQPAALAGGDVDAFMGTEPLCTQSVVDGVGVRVPGVFDTPLGDFNTAIWAGPEALADAELCRIVVEMQRAAAEYLSPDGANDEAVWTDLLVEQFDYPDEVAQEVLETIGARWEFDDERVAQFEAAGAVLVEQGLLTEEPDYERFYAREFWTG